MRNALRYLLGLFTAVCSCFGVFVVGLGVANSQLGIPLPILIVMMAMAMFVVGLGLGAKTWKLPNIHGFLPILLALFVVAPVAVWRASQIVGETAAPPILRNSWPLELEVSVLAFLAPCAAGAFVLRRAAERAGMYKSKTEVAGL